MKLPKAKNFNAKKYVAGLSLFNKRTAQIKLSANESALGPSPKAVKEYIKISKNFKRYPDSDGTFLRKTIAKKFKLDHNRIILGAGSDQIFEFVCRAFLKVNCCLININVSSIMLVSNPLIIAKVMIARTGHRIPVS
jgi:histidinol-phosphate aminotransferase